MIANGRVVGVLGTYEDITERKLAEQALRQARDELEARVQERTLELSTANHELKQQIAVRRRAEEMLRRREAILEALTYTSYRLLAPRGLDQTLPDVLAQLGLAVGFSRVYLLKNSAAEGPVQAAVHACWEEAERAPRPSFAPFAYEEAGLAEWQAVLEAGQPLYGRDFPAPAQPFLAAHAIRTLAWLPVFSEGVWWGVLGLDDDRPDKVFIPAEVEALKSAANALGAAFAQQRSRNAEREQRTLAEALRDTTALLNSTLDLDEVLDRIVSEIGKVVPHDAANIILVEDQAKRVIRYRTGPLPAAADDLQGSAIEEFPNLGADDARETAVNHRRHPHRCQLGGPANHALGARLPRRADPDRRRRARLHQSQQ